jgi:uncharacterized protein
VLLGLGRVGRIGLSVGALPVILPVNYTLVGDRILVCTARGTKLAAATHDQVVAFQVDDFDSEGSTGWSVLVRGIASEVTDPRVLANARRVPVTPWAVDGIADRYVTITTEVISGRRFDHLSQPLLSIL